MPQTLFYLMPLLSGFVYAVSSLALKRGMECGAGAIRSVFMCNIALWLCFLPLLFFSETPFTWVGIHRPITVGFAVFLGQLATVTAIRVADVTVQGPMMGIKIVFVATLAIVLGAGTVTTRWWIAACLAAVAIFVLGCSGFKNSRSTYLGALFALTASFFFATEDVLVQKWAADYGAMNFIVIMMTVLGLMSFFLVPLFRWRLRDMSKTAFAWMSVGSLLMGLQGILFTVPIAINGNATVVNILYSSRGIWSIVLVVCVGGLFNNKERDAGTRIMVQRFIGAMLLFFAIVLVLAE